MPREVRAEPIGGKLDDLLESASFFKKMRGAWDNVELSSPKKRFDQRDPARDAARDCRSKSVVSQTARASRGEEYESGTYFRLIA